MKKYLTQHLAMSLLKQARFNEKYGKLAWDYDVGAGALVFGGKQRLAAQILGTYAQDSNTWLWSWANTASGLPAQAVAIATKLREWGKAKAVGQLTTAEFTCDRATSPELLGLLAIGLAKLPAFFIGRHEHGAVVLLVTSPDANPLPKLTNTAFINHLMGVIQQGEISSHRDAVVGFCNALGWQGEMGADVAVISNPHEKAVIRLAFDTLGRITSATTTVG